MVRVRLASSPADLGPSTQLGQATRPVALLEHPEHALVLAHVLALAVLRAPVLARVPEQAEHRLQRVKHLVRSALRRVAVAAVSSSIPRLKKAR